MKNFIIPWKRILILITGTFTLFLLIAILFIWSLISSAPDIDPDSVSPVASATYICDQEGNYLRKLTMASSNRDIVALEQIPDSLQNAMIAIEDSRFYEHEGIDLRGIFRAFVKGITSGSFTEGASTITQQLIKNSVFTEWTQENSFLDRFRRKIQEQYLALQLENQVSKSEILEDYLNTINMGAGCYGVQASAKRYFGKNVSELTLSESAVLAAIPQNPTGYNPILYPQTNRKRQKVVLDYMKKQGYISDQEYRNALADDVYSRIQTFDESFEENSIYTYYEDALINQVTDLFINEFDCTADQAYQAVYSGGLRIFSAQDPSLQKICDEEFANPYNFPEGTLLGIDYALSIADENNHVTHYGNDTLKKYVQEHLNPQFNLLCSSEEEAKQYADAFCTHILQKLSSETSDPLNTSENAANVTSLSKSPSEQTVTILGERLTLSPQPQASLTLIDQNTGCVRAIVGGRGEKTASLTLNRATETTRQPGSTFKILAAYAPALETAGQTLATIYENEPYKYENGTPVSNWDITDYSGPETIREAITRSINVIAVKCLTEITPQAGFDFARRFGISTLHESYETAAGVSSDLIQPLALGGITEGVTNLELCGAYAAIANGGIYREPKFFTKIEDRNGKVIFSFEDVIQKSSAPNELPVTEVLKNPSDTLTSSLPADNTRILSESTAFLLTSAMADVISSPSGTAYGTIRAAGHPAAGKTGTTSNYKDIWFAGYTPYYTCCVWGGYDNNQELPDGSTYHSYSKFLWSAVMERIHADLPVSDFPRPDTVTEVSLCSSTHLPAKEGICPEIYTEYFAKGTETEKTCDLHKPEPETEPIYIYPDVLDQLITESESETLTETITESESDTESENTSESDFSPESDSESESHFESESTSETQPISESDTIQPDTSSFDDLINRLTEDINFQTFSLP